MPTTQRPARRFTRRQFLQGCSAAIAAMAGARLTHVAYADPTAPGSYNEEIMVVVFLRGGWDALNVVVPIAGADRGYYEDAREELQVPANQTLALNAQFGLHPALAPLLPLYQAKHFAIVHAVGLTYDTRSHFDAQQFLELGTPGQKNTPTGWITRHLESAPNLPPTILLPALSAGSTQAMALLGSTEAAAMSGPNGFNLSGHWHWGDPQRAALRELYTGANWLYEAGTRTLDTIDLVEASVTGTYTPANGAVYPNGSFGDNLKAVAQMIKADLGLRVATIDLGGWDTHENQGDEGGGYLASNQLAPLAQGLAAFYTDLSNAACAQDYTRKLTLVVMSEFGRRLKENFNHGTDHGHGNAMFVLGGHVNGGQVYGNWPGLANAQLYDGYDLAVTTDYRRVLSEIVSKRLTNPNLATVFPGYAGYTPLNLIQGSDPVTPPVLPGPHRLFMPLTQTGGCS
ncbi:MAG: DUF1501 domain-containing protein [Anaerolineales bacterium]|nr:DUF1501 domain-containing protein [Anaerolineales bacterium]